MIPPEDKANGRVVPTQKLKATIATLALVGGLGAAVALARAPQKAPGEPQAAPQAIVSSVVLRFPTVEAGLLRFTRLSTADGLSHTRVAHIVQDPQGYMWLGTQYGLDRYDGYEFRHFVHDPRRNGSLAGTFVTALFKDRDGTIWVACSQVLDRFDAKSETFTHYRIDSGDTKSGDGTVVGISQGYAGFLWLSTGRGLYRMDPKTGALTHFYHDEANPHSLSTNDIKWTGEDRSGQFWVGTADGLDKFDRTSGRVLLHVPIPDGVGISFFEDSHGLFWITHASGNGLALFDRSSNTVRHVSLYAHDPPANALTGVMGALEDQDGALWFGSPGGGVMKFDRDHQRFLRYRFRGGALSTPVGAEDEVIVLAQDREGEIWAGLHSLGLNHFSRRMSPFRVYRHEAEDPNSLDIDFVNAIYVDKAGQLWIGNDLGLNRIDPTSGRRELLTFGLGAKPMVISIVGDAGGAIWFGTFSHGLGRYDPATGDVRFYQHDSNDPASLSNNEVHKMLIDRSGVLWVATDDGLDRFDSTTGRFTTYKVDPQGRRSQSYLSIAEASDGVLWLGTHYSGLHRLDVKSGRITVFRPVPGDLNSLRDNSVPSVLVDDSGLIWAGTLSGLNSFDPKSGAFRAYDVTDGLAANFVSCILKDPAGFLWMSTNRGLSKFAVTNGTFVNYTTADGLPGNDLTGWGSCFRSPDGQMYFAGYPGAVAFNPDAVAFSREELSDRSYRPPVALTSFQLFGKPIALGPGSPLQRAIGYTDQLTLAHNQNSFSFGFAALSFGSPSTNRYRYKLEGLDHDWHEVGSDRRYASYTTLPAGAYRFRVQGATIRGPWSEPGAAVRIIIKPPWWATWWARGLFALAALLTMLALYLLRVGQLRRRFEAQLEARVSERTRVARELHDTLLQSFQGLLLRFQTVWAMLPSGTKPQQVLGSVIDQASRAITEARDAVQGLRPSTDETTNLAEELRTLGELAAAETNSDTVLRVEVEGTPRRLHPMVRDEVYRFAGEALRNAFRHAAAGQIEVELHYEWRRFRLRIRDDGKGFDPNALSNAGERQDARHYGLRGMHERAIVMGGTFDLWSAVNSGTEVELTIPGARAYARSPAAGGSWRSRKSA